MDKSFTVNDVKRAENTCKMFEDFIQKIKIAKKYLLDLWANLFDTSCVLREIWKANELAFYDREIQVLTEMIDLMLSKQEKIITTSNSLKRKFNERDADEEENKVTEASTSKQVKECATKF